MRYRIAPLYVRPWTLNGISARLIESHYEHNYGSAVVRLNAVSEELEHLDIRTTPAPFISRLKREQTMLLNSTLLHELYFASLGGDGRAPTELISGQLHAISARWIVGAPNSWRSRKRSMVMRDGSF
jgi:Fe-Mn family superoxide dismutase